VFLVVHLVTASHALDGRDAFSHAMGATITRTGAQVIEVLGIALPLAFHALYGIVRAARATPGVTHDVGIRNWLLRLQRVSGGVALGFIVVHLWHFRLQRLRGVLPWQHDYDTLARTFEAHTSVALYVVGLSAVVFHFAHGVWRAAQTLGVTVTAVAIRRSAVACIVAGFALWIFGYNTLLHFTYRCGGVLPRAALRIERACVDVDSAPPAQR
jgi:succinate dehydrogenase / fumarate reductase cytochrome b subunit